MGCVSYRLRESLGDRYSRSAQIEIRASLHLTPEFFEKVILSYADSRSVPSKIIATGEGVTYLEMTVTDEDPEAVIKELCRRIDRAIINNGTQLDLEYLLTLEALYEEWMIPLAKRMRL